MKKEFTQAPLPFQGQKRGFLPHFKSALKKFKNKSVFVDLFGGSGLLSHAVKCTLPHAKVVFNDFDNYSQRLKNIPKTNIIISDIRQIVKGVPSEKKIPENIKRKVLQRIKAEKGFVDYITLSSSLLFSGRYANSYDELAETSMYNNVKKNNYEPANGYLNGIDIVCLDYRKLFLKYRNTPNVVFLFDPPYLSTEVDTYNSRYWKLSDYLEVLLLLTGQSYFYFTSNKSNLIELYKWIEVRLKAENPFKGAVKKEITAKASPVAGYIDMMFYKNLNNN